MIASCASPPLTTPGTSTTATTIHSPWGSYRLHDFPVLVTTSFQKPHQSNVYQSVILDGCVPFVQQPITTLHTFQSQAALARSRTDAAVWAWRSRCPGNALRMIQSYILALSCPITRELYGNHVSPLHSVPNTGYMHAHTARNEVCPTHACYNPRT